MEETLKGMTGEALTAYWAHLFEHIAEKETARDRPADSGPSRWERRYGDKIALGAWEAFTVMLHSALAPDVRRCNGACPHLAAGMSPEQVKGFLASLDAYVERRERLAKSCSNLQVMEDAYSEISEVSACRREFLSALSAE